MKLKIEVTLKEQYVIDTEEYPSQNPAQIVEGWFKDPNMAYAGRDGHRIGNSIKFIGWEPIE